MISISKLRPAECQIIAHEERLVGAVNLTVGMMSASVIKFRIRSIAYAKCPLSSLPYPTVLRQSQVCE